MIKDKDQGEEVYAALKTLQNEIEEASFRRSLQQFLVWLRNRIAAYGHVFRERVRLSTTRVGYVLSHWNKSEHEHVRGKFPSNVEGGLPGA